MLTWRKRLRSRTIWSSRASRIRRLVEPRHNRLDELARQPRDALIFRLHAGSGLQHEPCHVDGETERQDQRQKQIDAGTQG